MRASPKLERLSSWILSIRWYGPWRAKSPDLTWVFGVFVFDDNIENVSQLLGVSDIINRSEAALAATGA